MKNLIRYGNANGNEKKNIKFILCVSNVIFHASVKDD